MTPLYRAFTLLSIAVLSTADPDGLTNCGETSTVPGLIGENTTVSFPIAGTCKTVIANYADGTEESISIEPSTCGSSGATDGSQVYQIAFGSSSPRGLASILFNCNGGLQVFCQRYNITMGDAPSTQDKTTITAMCNETTTYPLLPSGGSLGGVIASTPSNTGQVLSTLLTASTPVLTPVPTPFQGTNGPAGSTSNAGTGSIPGSGQNQEQSSGNNSGETSGTADTFPTNSNGASPQASVAGGSGAPGGDGMNTSSGAPSGESESTGSGSANTSGGTPSGGSTNTIGATPGGGSANESGGSTTPSTTAVGGQSIYFPINTPNNPYAASTPQPSCTCLC